MSAFLGQYSTVDSVVVERGAGSLVTIQLEEHLAKTAYRAMYRFIRDFQKTHEAVDADLVSRFDDFLSREDVLNELEMVLYQRDPYTSCELTVSDPVKGFDINARGYSKRNPRDKRKASVGVGAAIYRAFTDLYRQLLEAK